MKLSRIYSNRADVFDLIDFNDGLNVIYARVTKPKDNTKDSHNLGKTLLIHLIDFLLLKTFGANHFLYDNQKRFEGFVFFLELRTNSGKYVTIRRGVDRNTKISFKVHADGRQNFGDLDKSKWDQWETSFDASQSYLNVLLSLTSIAPWDYRKGVTYFLRTQIDYLDVFQIGKFASGRHVYWKPYMASVLGFDSSLVQKKYELDDEIEKKETFRRQTEQEFKTDPAAFDKVKGTIQIKQGEVAEIRGQIDRFNFYEQEIQANAQVADQIETQLGDLHNRLYTIKYELGKIRESLGSEIKFDVAKVQRVFEEAKVVFPDQLVRSYEQLLDFNRRLSEERNRRLAERAVELEKEQVNVDASLKSLNARREELLSFLQDRDTFSKFKVLQTDLVRRESEVVRLQSELDNLSVVTGINRQIKELVTERDTQVSLITEALTAGNTVYTDIRTRFTRIIKEVLDSPALLSISINKDGNFDFEATLLHDDVTMLASSEGKGTSYKKLLCAAFDMAVLEVYSKVSFFRFVYHDGVLEGLDNRKKQKFLDVVKAFCETYKLQYIMTVIDADIPRDQNDKKVMFAPSVVIKTLHEDGDAGRLFKMPKF